MNSRSPEASKQAVATRRTNSGQFKPGVSGNPRGRTLAAKGTPSAELVRLAREFAPEAIEIAKDIARTGDSDEVRLRACRLIAEIASTPDATPEQSGEPMQVTVKYVSDGWRASTG